MSKRSICNLKRWKQGYKRTYQLLRLTKSCALWHNVQPLIDYYKEEYQEYLKQQGNEDNPHLGYALTQHVHHKAVQGTA